MDRINVLDCTLRDGGYCNQWSFGKKNISKIINTLIRVNVEIIECGILTDCQSHTEDNTLFNSIEQISEYLPEGRAGKLFVCLVDYGKYEFDKLVPCDGTSVTGIRVAFHKKDAEKALQVCQMIKEKGYEVFVQPMVSQSYSDEEFLQLIHEVNNLHPYACYIVDSFGGIMEKDLKRLFFLADNNLAPEIYLGFHSHNNLQLAYANAQALTMIQTFRKLIIDCSVMGMGRGAGNLNTELFVEYLNQVFGKNYRVQPMLVVIDQIINNFYRDNYWGYSLSNYLSAKHNVHPNYAKYLTDKQTLTVEDIDKIFMMMNYEQKVSYDSRYIESLYIAYMGRDDEKAERLNELRERIADREVLVIAPGSSCQEEKNTILTFLEKNDVITISINFDYPYWKTDYIFLSNLRRYEALHAHQHKKCIVTSNIPAQDVFVKVKYTDLLNGNEFVRDNAGMMLIKCLIDLGVKKIILAGMDGYSEKMEDNYFDQEMAFKIQPMDVFGKNRGMSEILHELSEQISIVFLTKPQFIKI